MNEKKITSNIEDYLEAIHRIEREKGVVRVKEISRTLGVTYPSTSGILKKIEAMDLVEHERYGYVRLTERGRKIAAEILRREEALELFLREMLKLPEDLALEDACKMEHAMGGRTADRFLRFIEHVTKAGRERDRFFQPLWKEFSEDGGEG